MDGSPPDGNPFGQWHDMPPRGGPHRPPPWGTFWYQRQRWFFARLVRALVITVLFAIGGMTLLGLLFSLVSGGNGHAGRFLWVGGCGLALALPLLAVLLGARTFRSVAVPLTDILSAIEAVAGGDLSVRVPEQGQPEMSRLSRALNRMLTELERADQQRRNLTADVAHELRTPLHIIQGNLEGILDGVYQPTQEHIEATLEETRLLARLVDDLRTLSLAESGQLPLVQEPLDVHDLLADVATSFSVQAETAGIALHVADGPADALTVIGDAGRLDQVLGNLVSNAIVHTPRGGRITLSAAAAGKQVRLTVADTGEGIAPADLPFIFDRFWRGDRARSHSNGAGSGLGLTIASQLVRAHGGDIHVASELGRGTTFTVTLPAASDNGPRLPPSQPETRYL